MKNARVALLVFLLAGCATAAVHKRLGEIKAYLDPRVGKATTQEILIDLGPPQERQSLEGIDIWTYRRTYGVTATATPIGRALYANGHESYDQVQLMFKDGVLLNWKSYVQR